MKDKSKLIEIISNYYKPPFNQLLIDEIKKSIRIKSSENKEIKIGDTKLGGVPHLPIEVEWPKDSKSGKHYIFVTQINLKQIESYNLEKKLPEEGILYFFVSQDHWDDGVVVFEKEIKNIEIKTPPIEVTNEKKNFFQKIFNLKGHKVLLKEYGVEIFNEYHIPSQDSLQIEKILKTKNLIKTPRNIMKEEVYENGLLYDDDENDMTANHHLLGNYNGIQNEYYQLNLIDSKTRTKKLTLNEINQALEWELLMQIDSDNMLDLNWGDSGKIYFFIHKEDLKNQRFNKVKIIGECY